ncbi:MAG: NTP transferase domain-containing protein [Clostridia bacterium]|nr:NTP transferase domain-containing protein [Clostridia bacterium]
MKAVIMAGGEGKRLRPLTCTLPKPMAKILGKPVLEYIFDLLCMNGVTDAAVTLGYMPHAVEKNYEYSYKNMNIRFIKEDEPLGTAGSVKNAAAGFKEPFVVISGDAMCDFDLEKIMLFHKASNAKITIVATDAPDPREYGVIKVGEHNRVVGFIEKPAWNQAISSLANTGVYIINPECLDLIPNGKKYDFASDLFPLMLERDMPVFCYHTDGYWCDIGNVEAYLKCQRDMFDGKINVSLNPTAGGVYTKNGLPDGDYAIVPPVYIGSNVEIEDGAVIGPYAVTDDNCYIGKNAKVKHSVILENSWLAAGASVTGALVCSGAALKKRAAMYENSVAGSGSVIGEDASLMPGVLVWPGKIVGCGSNVSSNVKYGSVKSEMLGENGINEKNGARLNAETCVRLGAAVGNTRNGRKTGVANDGSKTAGVMQLAITAGLSGSGSTVWDFGECFESQLNFLVNFCGLGAGLFISGRDERTVKICGEGGLSIPRFFEREIESGISRGEFREIAENEVKEISDMSSVKLLYSQELFKQAPYGLQGIGVTFRSENESIRILLENSASRLGAHESEDLIFDADSTGMHITAQTENGNIGYEKLLAVCCFNEMKNGRDISVPYDAPAFLDSLAESCGRKAFRYLSTPADNSDSAARRLAAKQIFVRDGLFLAVKLLSVMKEREMSLDELVSEIPEKYIVRKSVPISFSPTDLSSLVGEEKISIRNDFEGIRLVRDSGRLLIIPERGGERVKILAEADTMEAANELCTDIEDIIESAAEIKQKQNI